MSGFWSWLVEPGFFSNSIVQTALLVGGVAAFTAGVVGLFTVLRRQAFAGEALGDVGATGGSGAFLSQSTRSGGLSERHSSPPDSSRRSGHERAKSRDLATGVVLGAALGLAALFLYFDTTHSSTTGASITVLFGSLFVIDNSIVPAIIGLSAAVLAIVFLLYRPLLLATLSPDLAQARGIHVRLVGAVYLLAMALAVSLNALTIGAVLSTALLIGPPATALRLVKSPGLAALVGGAIGMFATWLGILLAYDSYDWPPEGHGWPVSFLVVALDLLLLSPRYGPQSRAAAPRQGVSSRSDTPGDQLVGRAMFTGLMLNTWIAASIVAIVAGVIGFFVVMRGSAFVAHAIPNGAFAGAAGASLIGANTILGLGVFSLLGALSISWLGRRGRHDVVTGLSLVLMLGLGSLFLSFSVEYAPEIYSLLFGEVLGIARSELWPIAGLGVVCLVAVAIVYRPLLFASVLPEVAEARGLREYRMELCFLLLVALTTTVTVPIVGTFLMFSLMVAPAGAARAFTNRPGIAVALSVAIALATVWAAIAVSYETNWPIGFFVGSFGAVAYGSGQIFAAWGGTHTVQAQGNHEERERRGFAPAGGER